MNNTLVIAHYQVLLCSLMKVYITLQTLQTHSHHCSFLEGPLHDHSTTTYDIVRESILNSSKYFCVVDGLVADIVHDVLEGCTSYAMKN